VNFNDVIKLKNAEQNCQSNGLNNLNNFNDFSVTYPTFEYNITQPTVQDNYKLKLLELSDEFKNVSAAVLPAVEVQTSSLSSTTTTTTRIVATIENDDDEDDEEDETSTRGTCGLPIHPSTNLGRDIGYRFGDDHRESRGQITISEPSINQAMNISFQFRTRFTHGLLFYSGSDSSNSNEFIALWLHKGRLIFAFDCGSGKGEIESLKHLNDDQWHDIDIKRIGNNATISIDSHSAGFIIPPGTKSDLQTDGIYYFGNLPSDEEFHAQRRKQIHHFKTRHHHLQFQGCLSPITINNQLITFETNVNNQFNHNIRTCYEHEESGVFINGQKELMLENSFVLGQQFNISFHFKSRVPSGLLLAATSTSNDNYLFIYLDKGNLVVTLLQNNLDEVHVVHWPNDANENEMCDGQWHTVEIEKDRTFVRLHVDKYEPDEEILANDIQLYTDGPLFIGRMDNLPAIVDDVPVYVGCLTNMKIIAIDDDNDEDIVRHAKALHTVDGIEYSCPTH